MCAEVYAAGEYETTVNQEKQDGTHTDLRTTDKNDISQNEHNLKLNVRKE